MQQHVLGVVDSVIHRLVGNLTGFPTVNRGWCVFWGLSVVYFKIQQAFRTFKFRTWAAVSMLYINVCIASQF